MFRIACLALLTSTALAAPQTDRFTVRVKTSTGFVPVGEITRTNGKVVVKGFAAPALDKLADAFVADWKAYKWPAQVKITERLSSDTGMRPDWRDYSETFTPKDKLYLPAVIREFVTKRGYEALGMSSMNFIVYDRSAEYPPGAHDRASTHSNFRKNTELDFTSNGYVSFHIEAPVRTAGDNDSVLRVSASNPNLAVPQNWDDGTIWIATIKVFADGRVEIEPNYQGAWFEAAMPKLLAEREVMLMIDPTKSDRVWKPIVVKKSSPWLLEATIVEVLERRHFYDVTPVIDPAWLR